MNLALKSQMNLALKMLRILEQAKILRYLPLGVAHDVSLQVIRLLKMMDLLLLMKRAGLGTKSDDGFDTKTGVNYCSSTERS